MINVWIRFLIPICIQTIDYKLDFKLDMRFNFFIQRIYISHHEYIDVL